MFDYLLNYASLMWFYVHHIQAKHIFSHNLDLETEYLKF